MFSSDSVFNAAAACPHAAVNHQLGNMAAVLPVGDNIAAALMTSLALCNDYTVHHGDNGRQQTGDQPGGPPAERERDRERTT